MLKRNARRSKFQRYKSYFLGQNATNYADSYSTNSANFKLHEIERGVVLRILENYFSKRKIVHIDFACGFGLWLSALEGSSIQCFGIDASPDMLNLVPQKLDAQLFLGDRQLLAVPLNDYPRVITAFRFILNCNDEDLEDFGAVITKYLRPNKEDLVICNIHGNSPSLRSMWMRFNRSPEKSISKKQFQVICRKLGLQILCVHGTQLFPSGALVRFPKLLIVERLFAVMPCNKFATNRIYTLKRME
jgi:Methyltransferase domain